MPHPRLGKASRYGRCAAVGPRNDTRRPVVGEEVVEHPQDGDPVDVVHASRWTIRMQPLSTRPLPRVSTVQPKLVVNEELAEQRHHRWVLAEREPALSCRLLLAHLNMKRRSECGRREGSAQFLDHNWGKDLASHDIADVAERGQPGGRFRGLFRTMEHGYIFWARPRLLPQLVQLVDPLPPSAREAAASEPYLAQPLSR